MAGKERALAKSDSKGTKAEVKAGQKVRPRAVEDRVNSEMDAAEPNEQDLVAQAFRALGDPVRVRIFNFLRAAKGPVAVHKKSGAVRSIEVVNGDSAADGGVERSGDGVTVGEVVAHLAASEKTASTVSHHLKELRQAGLIVMKRRGKHMICTVHQPAIRRLAAFLIEPVSMIEPTE